MKFSLLLSSLGMIFYGIGVMLGWENTESLLVLSLILAIHAVAHAIKEQRL